MIGTKLNPSQTESRLNIEPSNDSKSSQGASKLSTRRFEIVSRDWRTYFKEEELENAFQVVEIEKRDIPEEDSSDLGSNSDPSDGNFDPDEICEKVYQLPHEITFKIIKDRKT